MRPMGVEWVTGPGRRIVRKDSLNGRQPVYRSQLCLTEVVDH
jgi:hypothetical protein